MTIQPKIFIVLRDGTTTKLFRRIRRRLVDAVVAGSEQDAMRLATSRNPLRPNERFQLLPVIETKESLEMISDIRARRDAEIAEIRDLAGV
jgi:hypothetical protein